VDPQALSHVEIAASIKKLTKELPDVRSDASRLDELRRLFSKAGLKFGQAPPENRAAAKWHSFLLKNHKKMVSQLSDRIEEGRRSSIRCLFGVIASSPLLEKEGSRRLVNADLLQKWYQSMCSIDPADFDAGIRHMVKSEFIMPYRDIQYYSFGCIARLAVLEYKRRSSSSQSMIGARLMELLMMMPSPSSKDQWESGSFLFEPPAQDATLEEDSDDSASVNSLGKETAEKVTIRPRKRQKREQSNESFRELKSCRREFQKAWLAVLKLPLPKSSLKRALQFLPEFVLNCVPNALMFSDFFMEAYKDHGDGVAGVSALEGLFHLITHHGLEYPNFYSQLYCLVSPRVMHAKYRGRFLSLLSKCLTRNELLPAHIVAAFSKRLCRSAISSPPSTGLFVLALVSNLLRKHSECRFLIQRSHDGEIEDAFVTTATDPTESQALRTSLWEVVALEKHYCASVAVLAKSLGTTEESKLPLHQIEEFSDHTYESLFEMERKKRKKTALAFVDPQSLLTDNDVFSTFLTTTK